MAETKTVNININSNAKQAAQDLNATAKAANNTAQAVENLGNAQEEAGDKSSTFEKIKEKVFGMVPALRAADEGVGSFISNLKALMANPIVLVITGIVAALKFIYEAFAADVKIGKEIKQVWAGLEAVGTQIKDAIFGLARAFGYAAEAAYKFITLDFAGASEAISKANKESASSFDQLAAAANGTTYAIVKGLEKRQQANDKARKDEEVRASEVEKMLVQSRETLLDELATFKEKRKALDDVTKAEKSYAALKVKTAKEDLDILEAKAKALKGNAEKKMKQEIREATIALNEAEKENALTSIKLHKQRKLLAKQEADDAKAKAEEVAQKHKEKQSEYAKLRKEALDKVQAAEKEYSDSFLSDQQKETNEVEKKYADLIALAKKYKQDTTTLEEARRNALNDINVKFAKIEEETNEKLLQQKREQYKKEEDLRRQQIAEEEAYFEQYTNITLTAEQAEVQAVTDKYFILIEQAKKYGLDTAILEEKQRKEIAAINEKYDKEEEDRRLAAQQKKINNVKQTLTIISDLAGLFADGNVRQQKAAFEIQKVASIAQATIDTYTSAQAAYRSMVGVPVVGPVLAVAAAAAAIGAGVMNIKKIASTKFEAAGSGGGVSAATPSAGGEAGASGVMSPNFNIVGNAQATNPLAGLGNQPIQAYVVSGEVTTAQSLDRNRINYATFG